jgi:predicted PurR-regulated permease PerM
VYVGLWILDIIGISLPHKETLAIIAGFTELIPYLGPLLGGIPALIIGTMTA